MDTRRHAPRPGLAKRVACGVGGGLLLVLGVVLLVLPGPGLLLVLAGLLVLANGFPAAQKFVDPVERRAMEAAEEGGRGGRGVAAGVGFLDRPGGGADRRRRGLVGGARTPPRRVAHGLQP